MVNCEFNRDAGYASARARVAAGVDFTAIFGATDLVAVGALAALTDAGLRVPEDVSIVDVTDPEVLPADSPLYTLPNVVLTPHIAEAWGVELARLTASAIEEIHRYVRGLPFQHAVTAREITMIA